MIKTNNIVRKVLHKLGVNALIRPLYNTIEDFLQKDILKQNEGLKNKFYGDRCFILCSGEPLKEINLDKLGGEFTFGMGHLYTSWLDIYYMQGLTTIAEENKLPINLEVNCFSFVEPLREYLYIGHNKSKILSRYIDVVKAISNSLPDPKTFFFVNGANKGFYQKHRLLHGRRVYYIKSLCPMASARVQLGDLTRRITFLDGTIFFAIAALTYMGFKEIYLCGAGYTYKPVYNLHFYDNFVFPRSMGRRKAETEAKKAINVYNRKKMGSVLEYYGLFEKDDLYRSICVIRKDHDPHKDKHRILNNYARSQGVKIYNIVPDRFESPIYEKIIWQEVESKILPSNPDNI